MAGHPLRPATRRSLGEPLPHQQADRPRAHPPPRRLSTHISCESASYPVLATVSGGYPEVEGRLLTCYSPVRRSCTPEGALPLDLHVLSTPPAFVLSQDQTLRRKTNPHPTKARRRTLQSQSMTKEQPLTIKIARIIHIPKKPSPKPPKKKGNRRQGITN